MSDIITFESWPKTPRLNRNIVITEKIDGTNAAVVIASVDEAEYDLAAGDSFVTRAANQYGLFLVGAQSRNRLIRPGKQSDNYGFAAWVEENARRLVDTLGPGRHFGEWWGRGIARGYGVETRQFSLFDVDRYGDIDFADAGLGGAVDTVPVLHRGPFYTDAIFEVVRDLGFIGSHAAPGFNRPEGVIVYHTAAKQVFKVLIENDAQPKSALEVAA